MRGRSRQTALVRVREVDPAWAAFGQSRRRRRALLYDRRPTTKTRGRLRPAGVELSCSGGRRRRRFNPPSSAGAGAGAGRTGSGRIPHAVRTWMPQDSTLSESTPLRASADHPHRAISRRRSRSLPRPCARDDEPRHRTPSECASAVAAAAPDCKFQCKSGGEVGKRTVAPLPRQTSCIQLSRIVARTLVKPIYHSSWRRFTGHD